MPKTQSLVKVQDIVTWMTSNTDPSVYWTETALRQFIVYRRSFQNFIATNNLKARPWSNYVYQINFGRGTPISAFEMGVQVVWPQWGGPDAFVFYRGKNVSPPEYAQTMWQGTPPELSEVRTIATAKLAATLKESRTQWQAAVALGEGFETMRMISSMATRLFKGFRAFKRGDLAESFYHLTGRGRPLTRDERAYRNLNRKQKDPESWRRDVASNWMEFSFGWRPVLSDIDSAARYLAERHVGKAYRVYGVNRAHKLAVESKTGSSEPWPDSHVWSTFKRVECKLRLIYELDPDWLRQPSTIAELGFTDPASVAWELLPLSCFADYIVNVGQVLESLYEFKQWTVRRGLESYKFIRTWEQTLSSSGVTQRPTVSGFSQTTVGPHGRYSYLIQGPQNLKQVECSRTLLSILPAAVPLRIKIDNPFDLKKGQWANVIGLGYLAFSGAKSMPELGEGAIHRVRTHRGR